MKMTREVLKALMKKIIVENHKVEFPDCDAEDCTKCDVEYIHEDIDTYFDRVEEKS
jgi:hypothetical protein